MNYTLWTVNWRVYCSNVLLLSMMQYKEWLGGSSKQLSLTIIHFGCIMIRCVGVCVCGGVSEFLVYTNLAYDHHAEGVKWCWKPFPVLLFLITCSISFKVLSYRSVLYPFTTFLFLVLFWLTGPLRQSLSKSLGAE